MNEHEILLSQALEGSPSEDLQSLGRAVLFTNSDAIVSADKDGVIRFWNPGAERVFGFTSGQAVGQSLDIIIPERLRKRHWDGYSRVMAGAESRYGNGDVLAVPALKADGTQISIEFTIVSLHDAAGALAGFAAIMRDVTARFEETRALRRKLADAIKAAS
jgi:PAS domain S-box-containing protein